MALIGLYLIAAGLLVVAGVAKAVRPDDTARALWRPDPRRPRAVATLAPRPPCGPARWPRPVWGWSRWAPPRTADRGTRRGLLRVVRVSSRPTPGHGVGRWPPAAASADPTRRPPVLHVVVDLVLAGAAAAVAAGAPDRGLPRHAAGAPALGRPAAAVGERGRAWLTFLALSALAALEGARRLVQPATARGTSVP